MKTNNDFKSTILQGIPDELPEPREYDLNINHAPRRRDILTPEEKKLALRNALRYFPRRHHAVLAKEFSEELKACGRIYMYRFRPTYKITARSIHDFPWRSVSAGAIMLMLSNNALYAL